MTKKEYTSYSNIRNRSSEDRKKNTAVWKKNNPGAYVFYRARQRAKRKGIPFTLTIKWAEKKANGKCEVTGIQFSSELGDYRQANPWSASIDRIDSKGPYSQENCRMVCWVFNCACSTWGEEPVREMARRLVL